MLFGMTCLLVQVETLLERGHVTTRCVLRTIQFSRTEPKTLRRVTSPAFVRFRRDISARHRASTFVVARSPLLEALARRVNLFLLRRTLFFTGRASPSPFGSRAFLDYRICRQLTLYGQTLHRSSPLATPFHSRERGSCLGRTAATSTLGRLSSSAFIGGGRRNLVSSFHLSTSFFTGTNRSGSDLARHKFW